jgi:hypothetical protein
MSRCTDVYVHRRLITDGSGNVLSSNEGKGVGLEYDSFGVAMFTSGTAQTPYRPAGVVLDEGKGVGLEEGLDFSGPPVACPLYANRALALSQTSCGLVQQGPPDHLTDPTNPCYTCLTGCYDDFIGRVTGCGLSYFNCITQARNFADKRACQKEYIDCVRDASMAYNNCANTCIRLFCHPPYGWVS